VQSILKLHKTVLRFSLAQFLGSSCAQQLKVFHPTLNLVFDELFPMILSKLLLQAGVHLGLWFWMFLKSFFCRFLFIFFLNYCFL